MLREKNKPYEFVELGTKLSEISILLRNEKSSSDEQMEVLKVSLMSCSEEIRISTFLVIIDSFFLDLDKRIKAYSKMDKLFSFLRHTDVKTELVSLNEVVDFYTGDLEGLGQVKNEWFQCRPLLMGVGIVLKVGRLRASSMSHRRRRTEMPKASTGFPPH